MDIMARKSKVESSPHFKEIVDLLLAGQDCRFVSDYLLNEYNEKISHTSICKFKKEKLNVKAAARKQIQDQEKKKKKDTQKKVKKAASEEVEKQEYLEENLEVAASAYVKIYNRSEKFISMLNPEETEEYIKEFLRNPDIPLESKINLLIDLEKLAIQHSKIQIDIYKEDVIEVNVKDVTVNLLERVKKKRKELNDIHIK